MIESRMFMGAINTDKVSENLRSKAIDLAAKKILITRFSNSEQEKDIHEPLNCDGHGRIHHFRRQSSSGWPENPLPMDPAAHKLETARENLLKVQVFQSSACNWRCWYCYVSADLLSANPNKASWLSVSEMVDLYQKSEGAPKVIDLSGGQPDLTPEWIPWMMRELRHRNLDKSVYLWSDDNLSNDYLLRFLSNDDLELMRSYRNYGKVCCFKGFDQESFVFNTGAAPSLFDRQFELFKKYLTLGIDLYAYITFTSPKEQNIKYAMGIFVERLQSVHPNLPLRTIPLEIKNFTPMQRRLKASHENAIRIQHTAVRFWNEELQKRFSSTERQLPIFEVSLTRD
jgi:uncharacterized Fe-S cluster-containing radical SAM superfamily protein